TRQANKDEFHLSAPRRPRFRASSLCSIDSVHYVHAVPAVNCRLEKLQLGWAFMQLAILTAVLAAIAAAEAGGGPVVGVSWRLVLIASATLIAPLAALVGTHRLSAVAAGNGDGEDAASRLETIVAGLWLATVALILLVGQWPRIVRSNWQLAGWPLIDELAILLPVIAPLFLVWAAMHRLEHSSSF